MSKNSGTDTHRMHGEACSVTGERFADWLRREYPSGARAKLIARDFDASPRTVEKWLAGNLPNVPTLLMMMARWRRRFVNEVLAPVIGTPSTEDEIRTELDEIRSHLAAIDARVAATMKGEG